MKAKILIVDDEHAIRTLVTRYLERKNYICTCAKDVVSAKNILAGGNFDLLLCDLTMPGESGLELLKFTKEHYPRVGRIVITGIDSPEVASDVLKIGVYGYIIKPMAENVVLITVENALRHLRFDRDVNSYKDELEATISLRTEKLSAIMNGLDVGVVMLDLDMKILEVNRKMQYFFPNSTHEKSMLCGQAIKSEKREETGEDCPMTITFQTGKPYETVKKLLTAHGERSFRVMTTPVFDKNGSVYAGIALLEDITERLLLERDLRQAQKLESVGQLAAGIAHEINSPIQYIGDNLRFLNDAFHDLTKVLQNYETFRKSVETSGAVSTEISRQLDDTIEEADLAYLNEEIPKTFNQSLDGVQKVDKIVRAMKDFSHPGGDEKTPMDINKIIESTVTVCRNEWKYVAEVSFDLAPDLPLVPCFPGEISQVLLNIIVNGAHAISDFTEGGSKGLGKISISTDKTASHIEIRISDTGGGIPEEIRDKIFDPFFTTKERGKGTGQGLAIAHRVVVDKHQGAIHFESQLGQGTTFIILLPLGTK